METFECSNMLVILHCYANMLLDIQCWMFIVRSLKDDDAELRISSLPCRSSLNSEPPADHDPRPSSEFPKVLEASLLYHNCRGTVAIVPNRAETSFVKVLGWHEAGTWLADGSFWPSFASVAPASIACDISSQPQSPYYIHYSAHPIHITTITTGNNVPFA